MVKSYAAGGAKYTLSIPRLDIRPGAKLAFVGESGSGKSTLLELLAMILRPDRSELFSFKPDADRENIDIGVAWQSGDADQLSDLRSKYVGYVLQSGVCCHTSRCGKISTCRSSYCIRRRARWRKNWP